MENFTPIASALGGVLIGLAAALMLLGLGRIAGVSGILFGILSRTSGDFGWRLAFVMGLVCGGLAMRAVAPQLFAFELDRSLGVIALAGLLVGAGTRMANGCTSGHGVCGVGRGSARSFAATGAFMITGVLTVFVTRQLLGGAP
jgi:uncharacterized membrane protein YedE/YeeE